MLNIVSNSTKPVAIVKLNSYDIRQSYSIIKSNNTKDYSKSSNFQTIQEIVKILESSLTTMDCNKNYSSQSESFTTTVQLSLVKQSVMDCFK